jgi:hypothetical protein
VETYSDAFMSNCSASPEIITEWRTAYVNGQAYPGLAVTGTISSPTWLTYTFPELILTLLQPGDVISQVILKPRRVAIVN